MKPKEQEELQYCWDNVTEVDRWLIFGYCVFLAARSTVRRVWTRICIAWLDGVR